jgi:hypothetical protein
VQIVADDKPIEPSAAMEEGEKKTAEDRMKQLP